MLSTVRKQTGAGKVRIGVAGTEEFFREVQLHGRRGGIAGFLLLTYLQLWQLGERASLNKAIEIVRPVLPDWEQQCSSLWSVDNHVRHIPTSRRLLLSSYQKFLPAAHLWAAFIHGLQNDRPDIAPDDNSTLPTFLGYAEVFLKLGTEAPWAGKDRRRVLPQRKCWSFFISDSLKIVPEIEALPELPHP